MSHDTDVHNDIGDIALSSTSFRNSLSCDIASKASETTPERATWVKEVSQQTEDCNTECWQYDKERTTSGRCTEPTKDTHDHVCRRLDGNDQTQHNWVMDTSYTIMETLGTDKESAL